MPEVPSLATIAQIQLIETSEQRLRSATTPTDVAGVREELLQLEQMVPACDRDSLFQLFKLVISADSDGLCYDSDHWQYWMTTDNICSITGKKRTEKVKSERFQRAYEDLARWISDRSVENPAARFHDMVARVEALRDDLGSYAPDFSNTLAQLRAQIATLEDTERCARDLKRARKLLTDCTTFVNRQARRKALDAEVRLISPVVERLMRQRSIAPLQCDLDSKMFELLRLPLANRARRWWPNKPMIMPLEHAPNLLFGRCITLHGKIRWCRWNKLLADCASLMDAAAVFFLYSRGVIQRGRHYGSFEFQLLAELFHACGQRHELVAHVRSATETSLGEINDAILQRLHGWPDEKPMVNMSMSGATNRWHSLCQAYRGSEEPIHPDDDYPTTGPNPYA